jgi:hypothetical protein
METGQKLDGPQLQFFSVLVTPLQAFAEEDVIFEEPALVGAQHTANRDDALVCSHCFRFIGSIGIQIAHRLLAKGISLSLHLRSASMRACRISWQVNTASK